MSNAATMNTGMTRAYQRDAIRSLTLDEDGKEFHLEVVLKAQALGYRFHEIPALLEWKEYKHQGRRVERKSSSKIDRLGSLASGIDDLSDHHRADACVHPSISAAAGPDPRCVCGLRPDSNAPITSAAGMDAVADPAVRLSPPAGS